MDSILNNSTWVNQRDKSSRSSWAINKCTSSSSTTPITLEASQIAAISLVITWASNNSWALIMVILLVTIVIWLSSSSCSPEAARVTPLWVTTARHRRLLTSLTSQIIWWEIFRRIFRILRMLRIWGRRPWPIKICWSSPKWAKTSWSTKSSTHLWVSRPRRKEWRSNKSWKVRNTSNLASFSFRRKSTKMLVKCSPRVYRQTKQTMMPFSTERSQTWIKNCQKRRSLTWKNWCGYAPTTEKPCSSSFQSPTAGSTIIWVQLERCQKPFSDFQCIWRLT